MAKAAPYFMQQGLMWRHQQNWLDAEMALRLAAQIEPTDLSIQSALAQFYLEWGRPDEASLHLRQALSLETRVYERLLLQGELAQLAGQTAAAENFFREALRAQPTRPEAYRQLAAALDALGQRAEAIKVLRTGLRESPPTFSLYLHLAQWLTQQGDFAEADRLYEQAQRLDPHSDEPWLLRAQNALAWHHEDDAEVYLQRALELEPNNAETQVWLKAVQSRRAP
jgi:Flp pilus assembly protein TadD